MGVLTKKHESNQDDAPRLLTDDELEYLESMWERRWIYGDNCLNFCIHCTLRENECTLTTNMKKTNKYENN